MGRVARLLVRLRGRHLLLLDLIAVAVAIYLAFVFRFDRLNIVATMQQYLPAALLPLVARPIVNSVFGLYSRTWRYASIPDLERITLATIAGSALSVLVMYGALDPAGVPGTAGFPRSYWLIEGLLSLSLMGGIRFGIRAALEWGRAPSTVPGAGSAATLFYGAGEAGVGIARSAFREPSAGVTPCGFLDDDPAKRGQLLAGLRVFGGLSQLAPAVAATHATRLLITMPTADGATVRRIVEAALGLGLEVRTVPAVHELLHSRLSAYQIRQVRVEDLLRRAEVDERAEGILALVQGKTVLISGAGGSIGSELVRQLEGFDPAILISLDRAEGPLYDLERELEQRRRHQPGPHPRHVVRLGDVADRRGMHGLVEELRPDIVFHAAAYKHVPMMEAHPSDAIRVNVGGTMSLLEAAEASGVDRFILVSTDKAVEPSNVMGATKRIAELCVTDTAHRSGRSYVAVRFGNVLGSSGSVLPIFQKQLELGIPLTVTDAEMTRYFMTIPEAVRLILHAATMGRPADLFVLDMGEPVRILDLAHDLVRLSGRDPASVPIEFVGLRPGEKLHESLFYDLETVERTEHPKVLRVIEGPPGPLDIRERARALIAAATDNQEPMALRNALFNALSPVITMELPINASLEMSR